MPDPDFPNWYKWLRDNRGFGWVLAIGAVLAALAAIPNSAVKLHEHTMSSIEYIRTIEVRREKEKLIAQADEIYFTRHPRTEAFELYKQAADLGSPYAKASAAKLLNRGLAGAPKNQTEASKLAEAAYPDLSNSKAPRDLYALAMLFDMGIWVEADPEKAKELFEEAALANHAPSQINLAFLYWDTEGSSEDKERAVNLFGQAAGAGVLSARLWIGKSHMYGWFGERDYAAARDDLTLAYEAGSPEAARRLAHLYSWGELGPIDDAQVTRYYAEGYKRGDTESTYWLARRTELGVGTERDLLEAYNLYTEAVAKGHIKSHYFLYQIYAGKLKVEGVTVNPNKAVEHLEKGAQLEDEAEVAEALSMHQLALVLQKGQWVAADLPRALSVATRCAEFGDDYCMNTTGLILWSGGLGVPKDKKSALEWLQRAANAGNYSASVNLGVRALNFDALDESAEYVTKAEGWLKAGLDAARLAGDTQAEALVLYKLGSLYRRDRPGFPANQGLATQKILEAAELGHSSALNDIGWRYWKGIGLAEDSNEAVRWTLKSLMNGGGQSFANIMTMHYAGAVPELSIGHLTYIRDKALKGLEVDANACELNELAQRYEKGETAPLDVEKANALYRRAAEGGNVASAVNFARLNVGNYLAAPDTSAALEFLNKAMDANALDAFLLMAELKYNGTRVDRNRAEAKSLLFAAESMGAELNYLDLIEKGFPETLFADQMAPLSCGSDTSSLSLGSNLLPE